MRRLATLLATGLLLGGPVAGCGSAPDWPGDDPGQVYEGDPGGPAHHGEPVPTRRGHSFRPPTRRATPPPARTKPRAPARPPAPRRK